MEGVGRLGSCEATGAADISSCKWHPPSNPTANYPQDRGAINDLCPDLILDVNLVLKLGPNTSFPELAWARSTRTARRQARLAHGRQPGSCGALYNECCLSPSQGAVTPGRPNINWGL